MGLLQHAAPVLAMMCCMAGCARSVSLEGKNCPCVSGWVCDPETNTCTASLDASSDASDAADTSPLPDVDISLRKRVFVSSAKYYGDIGGVDAASSFCASLAQDAGLGDVNWMAFLSIPGAQAIDRIEDVGPWYLVNQTTLVASDKAQLVSSDYTPLLDHAINMTEEGDSLECNPSDLIAFYNECGVWTGAYADGVAHEVRNCEAWTVASSSGGESGYGLVGNAHLPHAGWLNEGAYSDCGAQRRIYCFEQ